MAPVLAGQVDLLSVTDRVSCTLLVALTPGLLEMPSQDAPQMRPDNVAVALPLTRRGVVDHLALIDGARAPFGAHVEFLDRIEALLRVKARAA